MPPPRENEAGGFFFFSDQVFIMTFATLRRPRRSGRSIDAPPRDDYRFPLRTGSQNLFSRSSRLSELT